ncbi:MAG: LysM peptidoglycan-binding domain-containing protein [Chloroflexi bacterium]|nr:LysM peptidoglycan-binding domain-containing protein [Chloroflexota bacterium]
MPGSPTAAPTAVSPTPGGLRSYTVKAGDTLSDIATQFNTTVDAIVALNPGLNPNALAIGAELKIPAAQ